jgi:hypothetical protein
MAFECLKWKRRRGWPRKGTIPVVTVSESQQGSSEIKSGSQGGLSNPQRLKALGVKGLGVLGGVVGAAATGGLAARLPAVGLPAG